MYAPEKFPRALEKRILKRIAESLEILKINSLHLVLSALYDILVFETISKDFEHYSFNAKISERLHRVNRTHMSVEVVKITDFVETLIFALWAILKKKLEKSASHRVIFFLRCCAG